MGKDMNPGKRLIVAAGPVFYVMFNVVTSRAEEGGAEGGLAGSMLPMVGYLLFFGVIMYLLVYMPQKRKDKKAKELMNSLQVGYKVTTHSGIVGKVINIKDDELTVETGVERTRLDIKKWAVRDVEKPVEA